MGRLKKIFTNWRVVLWIFVVLMMVVAMRPSLDSRGVAIRSIDIDSIAYNAGFESPEARSKPIEKEIILEVENKPMNTVTDFYDATKDLEINQPLHIQTSRNAYSFLVEAETETLQLNETEWINVTERVLNNETNKTENITKQIEVNKTKEIVLGVKNLGINVMPRAQTNIRKGLDLQGGTRVLVEPEDDLSFEDLEFVVDNLRQRLNVFGLSDISVRAVKDLTKALGGSGKQFILVEVAGASKQDVESLISTQGKFEAQVANKTVFQGGSQDVTYVCREPTCSGIDPQAGCGESSEGYSCQFSFSIAIKPEAAKRFAAITEEVPIDPQSNGQYLTEQIHLVLDDKEQDSLNIASSLRGRAETNIQISGSGSGPTIDLARADTLDQMKELQTLLKTGSLPTKLLIVNSQTVSASLGEDFVKNAIKIGLVAALAVAIMIFIRYRRIKIVIPMLITSFSELLMLLGFAALIGWNIDLAAIAGLIIAVGTGVDHQIVITDEILFKENQHIYDWKKRIKSALTIIMVSYITTIVAMIFLGLSGAGLLKGFALVTGFGLTVGVFISRPAYAAIADILLKE